MRVGIISYGAYVPKYRIRPETIGHQWGKDGIGLGRALGINMKSVPGPDEDTATMSVEAARTALKRCDIKPSELGGIYVGSESHPYAVKPTGTIVAEAIETTPAVMCADLEFACKAGTAGIQICMALVKAGMLKYSMAIGADASQSAPGNMLEYSASAGASAFVIGKKNLIATINHTLSYTTDTPDFWRRSEKKYPRHGGRFTGKPAYFKHITSCAKELFSRAGSKPEDYNYAVFHQPNSKFPKKVGKMLKFTPQQLQQGLLVQDIGNTYSGALMLGLASILDIAKPGERIFAISYGSGAGADGFDITVTNRIEKYRKQGIRTVQEMIENNIDITYGIYSKYFGNLKLEGE